MADGDETASLRPTVKIMTTPIRMQTETAAELDAMLPAVLDKAFKGKL